MVAVESRGQTWILWAAENRNERLIKFIHDFMGRCPSVSHPCTYREPNRRPAGYSFPVPCSAAASPTLLAVFFPVLVASLRILLILPLALSFMMIHLLEYVRFDCLPRGNWFYGISGQVLVPGMMQSHSHIIFLSKSACFM